jgi:transcriptional regulator with XRE-family HTH domain
MTQAEFAERVNTSVQWVSRVETGENVTLTTLAKIARALEVPVAQLLEDPTDEPREVKRGRPRKAPKASKASKVTQSRR